MFVGQVERCELCEKERQTSRKDPVTVFCGVGRVYRWGHGCVCVCVRAYEGVCEGVVRESVCLCPGGTQQPCA